MILFVLSGYYHHHSSPREKTLAILHLEFNFYRLLLLVNVVWIMIGFTSALQMYKRSMFSFSHYAFSSSMYIF